MDVWLNPMSTSGVSVYLMDEGEAIRVRRPVLLGGCKQESDGHRMAASLDVHIYVLAAGAEIIVDGKPFIYLSSWAVQVKPEVVLFRVTLKESADELE